MGQHNSNQPLLFINGEYNGTKLRLENIDENFLNRRQIPLGNIYREVTGAFLVTFYNWNKIHYKPAWEMQTLKKGDDFDDWLSFLENNSVESDEVFFRYIEKYLDIDSYLKWYALTNLMGGTGYSDHNIFFMNDFRYQLIQCLVFVYLAVQETAKKVETDEDF